MGVRNYAKAFILVLRAAMLHLSHAVVQGVYISTKSGSIETIYNGEVGQGVN